MPAAILGQFRRLGAMRQDLTAGLVVAVCLLPCLGAAQTPAYDSGGTGIAESYLRDANQAAYHGRYSEAIADSTKAVAVSPNFGGAYLNRAGKYIDAGRYDEAQADLNRVAAMHPDAIAPVISKITIELRRGDGASALADIKRVSVMPLRSFWHQPGNSPGHDDFGNGFQRISTDHTEAVIYALSSIAEQLLHMDNASLQDLSAMMKIEYLHPWYLFANHCYVAAVAGLLETAGLTCQEAIDSNAHDIGQYDSLGFVHLRMKQWDKAVADYNKALSFRPDLTVSLYGRGIAKRARGDIAGGNADIAAARQGEPDIAGIMRRLGAPEA
jgi:tetratricopeptide (TPR) repeat protein